MEGVKISVRVPVNFLVGTVQISPCNAYKAEEEGDNLK